MKLFGAVVKEQGVSFTIIQVKHGYLNQVTLNQLQREAPVNMPRPVILAESSSSGLRYFGRPDVVRFLSNISADQIPWQEFDVR
ncbi:hypothetical protein [Schleiferilactobacillus harbinensis]|uniref:Uncharacterized protein n=1 Tax=Schleiferilactobacillus harbinensis TaxID=304207 RepID=A0ABU7T327_9LACO